MCFLLKHSSSNWLFSYRNILHFFLFSTSSFNFIFSLSWKPGFCGRYIRSMEHLWEIYSSNIPFCFSALPCFSWCLLSYLSRKFFYGSLQFHLFSFLENLFLAGLLGVWNIYEKYIYSFNTSFTAAFWFYIMPLYVHFSNPLEMFVLRLHPIWSFLFPGNLDSLSGIFT